VADRSDPLGPRYDPGAPPVRVPTRGERLRALARAWLWPPRPETWAALLAAAVGGLGLHALLFQATLPSRLPSAVDWRAAAALLAREARPGDAVAVAPPWAGRARETLPERLPERPDVALPLLALPGYEGEDLAGVRRVWLVSLPDAPGTGGRIARVLAGRSEAVRAPQRLGALEVALHELRAPLVPLAFLPDRLAGAAARGAAGPCARQGRSAFRCGAEGGAWRQVRDVEGRPRVCVLVRLPADGGPVALEFPDVPVGRALRGHVAAGREEAGAPSPDAGARGDPVRVVLRVDGEEAGAAPAGAGPAAWAPFRIDTSRLAGPARAVTVEVRGAPGAWACVEAMTVP
jgi:hypothetical protein